MNYRMRRRRHGRRAGRSLPSPTAHRQFCTGRSLRPDRRADGRLRNGAGSALAQQPSAAAPAAKPAAPAKKPAAKPAAPAAPAAPAPKRSSKRRRKASSRQLIFSPWTKFCLKGQEANAKQVCFTGKDGRIESGMPVVAAVLIEPEGEPKKVLRVTLPLGMQSSTAPASSSTRPADDRALRHLLHQRLHGRL